MPIHDWTRVESGIFHDFHLAWIGNLRTQIYAGLLPDEYDALAEQITGDYSPDVLTLAPPTAPIDTNGATNSEPSIPNRSGVALATAPPKVRFTMQSTTDPYVAKQRTLTIRHRSNHRIVAIIEILSRGNKADRHAIRAFREKISVAIRQGIHVLLLDLWPPTPRDPQGIHGLIWDEVVGDPLRTAIG